MNNYLLNLAFFSFALFYVSCSDDDSNTEENDPTENIEGENEIAFTSCVTCPGFTLGEVVASNDNVLTETSVPESVVCKGEDGRAYLDGVLNEDFETYELYLANRQTIGLRCN